MNESWTDPLINHFSIAHELVTAELIDGRDIVVVAANLQKLIGALYLFRLLVRSKVLGIIHL